MGTGPGLAALWAGIRAREESLEPEPGQRASHLPGDQGSELNLLHTDHQVGRVSAMCGPLSGDQGDTLKEG